MKDYYDPERHGPMSDIPLDRRNCMLSGGYILCPALTTEHASCTPEKPFICRLFRREELKYEKMSLLGIWASKNPVQRVPVRTEECKGSDVCINLQITRTEPKTGIPPTTSEEYRDGKTDDPYCHGGEEEIPEWEEEQARNTKDGPEMKEPPKPTDDYREGKTDDPLGGGDPDAKGDYEKS
jgi:hypothetical protein